MKKMFSGFTMNEKRNYTSTIDVSNTWFRFVGQELRLVDTGSVIGDE